VKKIDYRSTPVDLKFDFLAPSVVDPAIKMDARRIRLRTLHGFHARNTPEAITIGEATATIDLGTAEHPARVDLPHPFTYLVLKLFAFRDQHDNAEKDYGRHHAFDIYTTIALITESEWTEAIEIRRRYATEGILKEATQIATELFGSPTSIGMLRLVEHTRAGNIAIPNDQMKAMRSDLSAIFRVNE
jgi:hypothetical protein